jgi:hypothetical protein
VKEGNKRDACLIMTRLVTYVRANSDREPWVWKEFTKAGPNLSWWFLIEASRPV